MATESEQLRALLHRPCRTRDDLHRWIRLFTGLRIPRRAVCDNHQAPFEYLCRAYFEPACDLVVWAPRGGGKTRLAALATFLDLLHKPGCAVRILGGSLEQSLRMWEHLLPDLERLAPDQLVHKPRTIRRVSLANTSSAAVLTQSERAVRGLRVQKLRCDEVELFKPPIWEAAQLVTRSCLAAPLAGRDQTRPASGAAKQMIRGSIEAISTYHALHGLMHRVVESAEKSKTPIIRWCLLEVLEKCPAARDCKTCPLQDDCRGIAKTRCEGFVRIDDAIAMKHRVSRETWDAEMLCRKPAVSGCVFPSFDSAVHVKENLPADCTSLAIDFGFNSPFVCLWICDDGTTVHVIDEYIQPQRTIDEHMRHIESRPPGNPRRICCDPAGGGRNDQTAESNIQLLRRRGNRVLSKHSLIVDGLELMRAALHPAAGTATLFIHPRCKRLIAAMQQYHYSPGGSELPLKDGTHDHPIDALRYFFVNRPTTAIVPPRRY